MPTPIIPLRQFVILCFICVHNIIIINYSIHIFLCLPHLADNRNNLLPINVCVFTQAGMKVSPNTGVTTGLSGEETSNVSISVFTAVRASGFVNK